MKTPSLVFYPDSALFQVPPSVTKFDLDLAKLIDEMHVLASKLEARGLAANQINKSLQVFVVHDKEDRLEFVNPNFYGAGAVKRLKEGCLSIPGVEHYVDRYEKVYGSYYDRFGTRVEATFDGEVAHTIQHEMDHLAGRVYLDRLGPVARELTLSRLKKITRWTRRLNRDLATKERKADAERRVGEQFAAEMMREVGMDLPPEVET